MEVVYKTTFILHFNKGDGMLQNEVIEKIALFKNPKNHKRLKVHKLKGRLRGCYSFSVNYRIRIVFEYESAKKVAMFAVDDHKVYEYESKAQKSKSKNLGVYV